MITHIAPNLTCSVYCGKSWPEHDQDLDAQWITLNFFHETNVWNKFVFCEKCTDPPEVQLLILGQVEL